MKYLLACSALSFILLAFRIFSLDIKASHMLPVDLHTGWISKSVESVSTKFSGINHWNIKDFPPYVRHFLFYANSVLTILRSVFCRFLKTFSILWWFIVACNTSLLFLRCYLALFIAKIHSLWCNYILYWLRNVFCVNVEKICWQYSRKISISNSCLPWLK